MHYHELQQCSINLLGKNTYSLKTSLLMQFLVIQKPNIFKQLISARCWSWIKLWMILGFCLWWKKHTYRVFDYWIYSQQLCFLVIQFQDIMFDTPITVPDV